MDCNTPGFPVLHYLLKFTQIHVHRVGDAIQPTKFLSRETGISGNFVGRIKGAKCPFDLQFLTWDFS